MDPKKYDFLKNPENVKYLKKMSIHDRWNLNRDEINYFGTKTDRSSVTRGAM